MKISGIRQELMDYIENKIFPLYGNFDPAHCVGHVKQVVADSLRYAAYYDADPELVYAAAAFHDTGLSAGREKHHLYSGRMVREDEFLRRYFRPEQIKIIAEAVEDHRASSGSMPRSLYGRIIAEADRQLDPEEVLRRTVQYGLTHYPELDREGHFERFCKHLTEKYAEGGYLQLWLPESDNVQKLAKLREIIADRKKVASYFFRFFKQCTENNEG